MQALEWSARPNSPQTYLLDLLNQRPTTANHPIAASDSLILVTGANGFIGSWVVRGLLSRGFKRIRCLTRAAAGLANMERLRADFDTSGLEVIQGNLLSPDTCARAARGVAMVYHLAAGVEKSFPGCFLNSVVTTRNLLDAVTAAGTVRRFVNISSLAVYSNAWLPRGGVVNETCPIDRQLVERYDPYAYGKANQDEIVREYGRVCGLRYVIVRPGITFGPGKAKIPGRVGIDTFGVFLHLGLGNRMPLTYVENCAEAIVLAGLVPRIEGEELNIVDDDLPRSREFLRRYKQAVRRIRTIPVPYPVFYLFSAAWEKYSRWSGGQLPPVFNRMSCEAYYKGQTFSNLKAKTLLGWRPRVGMNEALERYCMYARGHRGST
ncbi:MAG: NAD(P)-dependent oxidoreductase [Bryobacterales bacterium]|nr:NAD(P)-dependent oxidoreductase [Bryobacterales bacterium]